MIARLFTDHPESVGESYGEHALTAARFGTAMVAGGLACFVHALVPSLFTHTGSTTIKRLHGSMTARRPRSAHGSELPRSWVYEI